MSTKLKELSSESGEDISEEEEEQEKDIEEENEENEDVDDEDDKEEKEEEDLSEASEEQDDDNDDKETEKDEKDADTEYDIDTIKSTQYEKTKKSCMYKKSDESSEDENVFDFDEDDQKDKPTVVPPEQRITKPILTKYERVRLLSDRTTQLTRGAKPLIKNTTGLTSKKIAELELEYNVMPLKIRRQLPNGKYEIWFTRELQH
jgi:DNA-directed RNA polymerase subunit K/omega